MFSTAIIGAINSSPLNRGLNGADWVADPRNVAVIEDERDIVLFDYEGPGIFQIHVLFSSSRGRGAVERIKRALRGMIRDHRAEVIFGLVPDHRRDVKMMARWVGMKSHGERANDCGVCELFIFRKETVQ